MPPRDGNCKRKLFKQYGLCKACRGWQDANVRNGLSIEQMLAREDGQLKTQNQALEKTAALQFAEQQDIARLLGVGNSQAHSDTQKQVTSLKRVVLGNLRV
ncbi:unnamed protein product [Sphagnum jensenii]|uniref:Uncharacterized protein n=1 Tax=Sphagnum jensenii TaxID=128206 RepID=A0ABP1AZD1_9BRYO